MVFRDPCKKCLVRPCCTSTCQIKEDSESRKNDFVDSFGGPIIAVSIILSCVFIALLVFSCYQITGDCIILSSLIWLITFIVCVVLGLMKDFIEESKGQPVRQTIFEFIIVFVMLPIILLAFLLFISCEKTIGVTII